MNGRIIHARTPEARAAAAFFTMLERFVAKEHRPHLDYKDVETLVAPIIVRERLLARLEEFEEEKTSERKKILEQRKSLAETAIIRNPFWRTDPHVTD